MTPTDQPELGTAALLHSILSRGEGEQLDFDDLLEGFERRAYGVLLLIATLPTLLPGVAAVSGPIVALAGAQLIWGLRKPWLPAFVRRRRLDRGNMLRLLARMEGWLRKLERLCRPRWGFVWHPLPLRLLGLLLFLLGVALALPIPLTNYLFSVPILVLGMALTEQDGRMLSIGFLLGLIALVGVSVVYATLLMELLHWLWA